MLRTTAKHQGRFQREARRIGKPATVVFESGTFPVADIASVESTTPKIAKCDIPAVREQLLLG
ncbi:MAG: hypothetical protein ABI668_10285 [Sphingorhabdus sp.]